MTEYNPSKQTEQDDNDTKIGMLSITVESLKQRMDRLEKLFNGTGERMQRVFEIVSAWEARDGEREKARLSYQNSVREAFEIQNHRTDQRFDEIAETLKEVRDRGLMHQGEQVGTDRHEQRDKDERNMRTAQIVMVTGVVAIIVSITFFLISIWIDSRAKSGDAPHTKIKTSDIHTPALSWTQPRFNLVNGEK